MHKAISIIINLINELSEKHTRMSFLYGYDHFLCQHIIEVEPVSDYDSDNYLLDEVKAIKEFLKEFPQESILFVSNNEYIKVKDPIHFAKKGAIKYFSELYLENWESVQGDLSLFDHSLSVLSSVTEALQDIDYLVQDDSKCIRANFTWDEQASFAGENTYAMAA